MSLCNTGTPKWVGVGTLKKREREMGKGREAGFFMGHLNVVFF